MYYPETGWYGYGNDAFSNEQSYRFEATYYIKYNAEKALFALSHLKTGLEENNKDCFYYHVYLDLFLNASGAVAKRFFVKKVYSDEIKAQIHNNQLEYAYTSEQFPATQKVYKFRNYIEHIDDRGDALIRNGKFQGTFNVVFPNMSDDEKEEYLGNTNLRCNLLDLEKMEYHTYDNGEDDIQTINLNTLAEEIERILKTAEKIWDFLTTAP